MASGGRDFFCSGGRGKGLRNSTPRWGRRSRVSEGERDSVMGSTRAFCFCGLLLELDGDAGLVGPFFLAAVASSAAFFLAWFSRRTDGGMIEDWGGGGRRSAGVGARFSFVSGTEEGDDAEGDDAAFTLEEAGGGDDAEGDDAEGDDAAFTPEEAGEDAFGSVDLGRTGAAAATLGPLSFRSPPGSSPLAGSVLHHSLLTPGEVSFSFGVTAAGALLDGGASSFSSATSAEEAEAPSSSVFASSLSTSATSSLHQLLPSFGAAFALTSVGEAGTDDFHHPVRWMLPVGESAVEAAAAAADPPVPDSAPTEGVGTAKGAAAAAESAPEAEPPPPFPSPRRTSSRFLFASMAAAAAAAPPPALNE
mmetsp:Transcript_41412/g.125386  ORF Transcript_41412/g.125386 Transcript_41412/m.125386 type:complete len:363 (-) Transcript_41412:1725-2813(-)